ncbi:MAG TPA: sterol desaturase family protein [Nostocaceae cyanobacterium]|nr:sterol desaturase family protein [Nostocaceae cyanobacterium]
MEFKSVVIFVSLITFGTLETIFPFFNYRQSISRKFFANLILGLINVLFLNLTISLLLKSIWEQTSWLGFLNYINLNWLKFTISLLVLDGYMYLWHRLMHTSYLGWRLHLVHHTDNWMNISTAYRFHIIEVILSNFPKIGLIYLFGITPSHLLAYETLFAVCLLFHHSNWNLPVKIDKFLSYLLVTPNYHRAHHSQLIWEMQSNYASLLTIWDLIFKTRYYPKFPQVIKLGIEGENRNFTAIDLCKLPFSRKLK